ncbi:MAG TPA: tetrahydrofolate dehydrogenase/cyclohydrolase catalytic domain-containing protein [Longimicrobiales bacterium]|nr:tetrahydrofolate dehydrogenase/cyclohydrolase catalytic domain-containing protein [Longimicrobiales bacterium]
MDMPGHTSSVLLLDGRALAVASAPDIARRAAAVSGARGRAPALLLLAFAGPDGHVPHVRGKQRAAARLGIDVDVVVVPAGADEAEALRLMQAAASRPPAPDAVFVQVPFPHGMDGTDLLNAIPPAKDVDVMSEARYRRYMAGAAELPPVTVTAALRLLDAHDIQLPGRRGLLVAEPSSYAEMFVEAFVRRGVAMQPVMAPAGPGLQDALAAADLVIVAAGAPGLVPASVLAPGTVALDVGYYNPGGRGDIDVASGSAHLAVLMPVPGGVGPMTVSALMDRVVSFAGG